MVWYFSMKINNTNNIIGFFSHHWFINFYKLKENDDDVFRLKILFYTYYIKYGHF